eukprot:XP_014775905.1 PREDICTED: uncharacterized protein LOC106873182 [Octopus bimaculoides]
MKLLACTAQTVRISESKKSLQKEIAALEEKNKSLKEAQKSYLKLNGTCKNCEYLQLTLTTLRNSFQKIFEEKHELIQHLNPLEEKCASLLKHKHQPTRATLQTLRSTRNNMQKTDAVQMTIGYNYVKTSNCHLK